MKIAKTVLVTVAAVAFSFGGATSAFAAGGNGDAGTNSHYPPQSGHAGCGDAGTNSHYPSGVCSVVVKKPRAHGDIARAHYVMNSKGITVKTSFVMKNVDASKVTIRTWDCDTKLVKRAAFAADPSLAGKETYRYSVSNKKGGVGMVIVRFSEPGKRIYDQVLYGNCR